MPTYIFHNCFYEKCVIVGKQRYCIIDDRKIISSKSEIVLETLYVSSHICQTKLECTYTYLYFLEKSHFHSRLQRLF